MTDFILTMLTAGGGVYAIATAVVIVIGTAIIVYKKGESDGKSEISKAKVEDDNAKDLQRRDEQAKEILKRAEIEAELEIKQNEKVALTQVRVALEKINIRSKYKSAVQKQKNAALTQEKEGLENKINNLNKAVVSLTLEKSNLEYEQKNLEKIEKAYRVSKNREEELDRLTSVLQDELQTLEEKNKLLQARVHELSVHPLGGEVEDFSVTIADLEVQIRDHQKTIQKLRPEKAELIEKCDELTSQIQLKQNEIERLKLELNSKGLKESIDAMTPASTSTLTCIYTSTMVAPDAHSIQIKPDDSNELNKEGYIDKLVKNLGERKPVEVLAHPRNGGIAGSIDLFSTIRAVTSDIPSRALAGANLSFYFLLKGLETGAIKLSDNDKEKLLNLIIQNNRYIRQENDKNPTTFIKAAERFELKQYRSAMEFFANISYTLSAAGNVFPNNSEVSVYKQFAKIFLADSIAHYIYNLTDLEKIKKITVTNNFKIPTQSGVQNISKTVVDELVEILSNEGAENIIDSLNNKASFMASRGIFEIFTSVLNNAEVDSVKFSNVILSCCDAFKQQVKEKNITTPNAKEQYAQALYHINALKQHIMRISAELPPALPPRPDNNNNNNNVINPVAPPLPVRDQQTSTQTQTSSSLFKPGADVLSQARLKRQPAAVRQPVSHDSNSPGDIIWREMEKRRKAISDDNDNNNDDNNETNEFEDVDTPKPGMR